MRTERSIEIPLRVADLGKCVSRSTGRALCQKCAVATRFVKASVVIALFGLTEPIFVPRYWNPPSLFDLAQRTGFDIESLIFSFAIGGIGTSLYFAFTATKLSPVTADHRRATWHRFHAQSILIAPLTFVPLSYGPWNIIYAAIAVLVLGSASSILCRPELARTTFIGGALFFCLYGIFMFGLLWIAPGYIEAVWRLPALS